MQAQHHKTCVQLFGQAQQHLLRITRSRSACHNLPRRRDRFYELRQPCLNILQKRRTHVRGQIIINDRQDVAG